MRARQVQVADRAADRPVEVGQNGERGERVVHDVLDVHGVEVEHVEGRLEGHGGGRVVHRVVPGPTTGQEELVPSRRPGALVPQGGQQESRLGRLEHGDVELAGQRIHELPEVLLGPAQLTRLAVEDLQHVRPLGLGGRSDPSSSDGERDPQRIVGALPQVHGPEERVALVDELGRRLQQVLSPLAERHRAAVVHERRVVDDVPEARSRGARRQKSTSSP